MRLRPRRRGRSASSTAKPFWLSVSRAPGLAGLGTRRDLADPDVSLAHAWWLGVRPGARCLRHEHRELPPSGRKPDTDSEVDIRLAGSVTERSRKVRSPPSTLRGEALHYWHDGMQIRAAIMAGMRNNNPMRQFQLFTTAELARMRDRTASRNYSPERDEFRREHERHRAWGLGQRHHQRLRHLRKSSCAPRPATMPQNRRPDHRQAPVPAPTSALTPAPALAPAPAPALPRPRPRPPPRPRLWPRPKPRHQHQPRPQPRLRRQHWPRLRFSP